MITPGQKIATGSTALVAGGCLALVLMFNGPAAATPGHAPARSAVTTVTVRAGSGSMSVDPTAPQPTGTITASTIGQTPDAHGNSVADRNVTTVEVPLDAKPINPSGPQPTATVFATPNPLHR